MDVKKININQSEQLYNIASDIYDVSAHNNDATFESLSTLLSDENLSTLIPSEIRCGGMTIRFVLSSNNKYVQYRLTASSFSTNENDWQGVDDVPTVGSDNLVNSGAVADAINHINSKAAMCEEGEVLLSFGDKEKNDILEVYKDSYTKEIHVKTKDFNSSKIKVELTDETARAKAAEKVNADNIVKNAQAIADTNNKAAMCEEGETLLSFGDKEENDILEVYKDSYTKRIHVKTKDFDSSDKYTESFKGITSSGTYANLNPGETYFNSVSVNEFFRTYEGKKYYPNKEKVYIDNDGRLFVLYNRINRRLLSQPKVLPPLAKFDIPEIVDQSAYIENELNSWNWYEEISSNFQNQMYEKFDALMVGRSWITKMDANNNTGLSYPSYATSGDYPYTTYMYRFNKVMPDAGQTTCHRKHVLMLVGGVHGGERMAMFNLYLFAYNLVNRCSVNKIMYNLLTCYDIYIIPCLNGYSVNHYARWNGNGVNIERNMPTPNWIDRSSEFKPFEYDYSGTSAGSEFESKLIAKLIEIYNVDIFLDLHSYGENSKQAIYHITCSLDACRCCYQAAQDISFALKNNFPEHFGNEYDILTEKAGGVLRPRASGGDIPDYTNYVGLRYGCTIEVCEGIAFWNGERSDNYEGIDEVRRSKKAAAIAQYTLQAYIARLANDDLLCEYNIDSLTLPATYS